MTCPFCEIVAGTGPATVVRTWPETMAIVPLNPVTTGHTLIIPRCHVPDATADPEVTGTTMARAAELARNWAAVNIITSVGVAAVASHGRGP